MKKSIFITFIFVAILVAYAHAQIPQTMSYQGVLTEMDGKAVQDGDYLMTFRLYDTATGGNALWEEQQTVAVQGGIFNSILGSMNALNVPFNKAYWLGISIGDKPELTPRIELTCSPYSLNARSVYGVTNVFPTDGNVGIGTTLPEKKLHVAGDIQAISSVEISSEGFSGRNVQLSSGSVQRIIATDDFYVEYGGGIVFQKAGGVEMKILNGMVGIGNFTIGNDPTEKLQVEGRIHSTTGGFKFPDGTIQTTAATGGGAGDGHSLDAADGDPVDVVYVNNDGNVGVGTKTPRGKLETSHDGIEPDLLVDSRGRVNIGFIQPAHGYSKFAVSTTDYEAGLFSINNAQNSLDAIRCFTLGTGNALDATGFGGGTVLRVNQKNASGHIAAFQSEDIDRVVIAHNGSVGIGTSAPTANLHVAGNGRVGGSLFVDPDGVFFGGTPNIDLAIGDHDTGLNQAGDGYLEFRSQGALVMTAHYVNAGNRWVFIGEGAPSSFRDILTVKSIGSDMNYFGLRVKNANNDDQFVVRSDGNVGVGTATPTRVLTVGQGLGAPIADDWSSYSSRRWKTNIETIDNALETVGKLRGVSYNWKETGKHDLGLIAEEVGEVVPEIVEYEDNGVDATSVDYARLVAVLIEAVKEQQKVIESQKTDIASLAQRLDALEKIVRGAN